MEKTETPRDINDMSTPRCDDLAYKLWGQWSKPGEIEAFDLARQLERELAAAEKDSERYTRLVGMLFERSLHFRTAGNEILLCNNSEVLGRGPGVYAAIDAALNESRQKGEAHEG